MDDREMTMSKRKNKTTRAPEPEPETTHQEPIPPIYKDAIVQPRESDRIFWPKDKPLPKYKVRQQMPCRFCRRVLLDNLSQAVVGMGVHTARDGEKRAYFHCKACDRNFSLPVKED
jgi:hypothetical protein